MRLFHLAPPQFALSALALRRLKISRFSELNDPFELLAVNLRDKGHRQAFRHLKDELNKTKGLLCFSRSWANPVLWGHYAGKHTGMALGFDIPDHIPSEAIYADEPLSIPVDSRSNLPEPDEDLINRLLRTKFSDWRYEQEWRVFVQLDHQTIESGMYFYDFSADLRLAEVVLGPRCAIPIDRVRALVATNAAPVEVSKARIAFGSFSVVKDQSYGGDGQ